MAGGKIVGKLAHKTGDIYVLEWAGGLTFPIEALERGQRFAVKGALMGIVAVDETYNLTAAGIKGFVVSHDPWLVDDLYPRFRVRAVRGDFRLNPYAKPETVLLMQGEGDAEAEGVELAVIQADPAPATEPAPQVTANGSADA